MFQIKLPFASFAILPGQGILNSSLLFSDGHDETCLTQASLQNPESEASRKKDEADRLRAAEKFMKVGTGEAVCKSCGYEYRPAKGDPEYPISPGTYFAVQPPSP